MHAPPAHTHTGMAKKRKEGGGDGDREEIMKLTQMVKAWEFTCSFCFKKFASAQAMGGHQNAHRSERLEEKRLFVRDPIGYRKRAYVRALKSLDPHNSSSPTLINLHAATKMVVKHELPHLHLQPNIIFSSKADNDDDINNNNNNNNNNKKRCPSCVVMNFLPPKELSLVESVGIHAADHQGEKKKGKEICIQFSVEKPDLTLKL